MQWHAISAALMWALGDNHVGLYAMFAQFSRAASPVVLDAMWQGAAVAIVLFISLQLVPRVNAAHRFTAWTAGFVAVVALPFLPFFAHLFTSSGATSEAVLAAGRATRPWLEFDDRWAEVFAAAWIAASAFRLGQLALHLARLRRLWKTATPVAGGLDGDFVVPPNAVLCTTRELDRPSVIGFFAPRILIPEWLYARLTPQELEQVVLHEVEHLRRHDDWTNLIQKLILVLYPLNPALAWIERRLCREREMACDEGVVETTRAPRAYAACLASIAGHGLGRRHELEMARRAETLSLAAWCRRPELVERVHGILNRKPALSPVASRVLLSIVGCGLIAGSVELARCPQAIGFIAAPQPLQLAQADRVNLDRIASAHSGAAVLAKSEAGFNLVQANAILPKARNRAMKSAPPKAHRTVTERAADPANEVASLDADNGTSRQALLGAEIPAPGQASAQMEPAARSLPHYAAPQYLVFTAVEQVQVIPQNSREFADYDTGAANEQKPQLRDDAGKADASSQPQITITRLIFRIAPATAQATSDAGPSTSSAKSGTPGTEQNPSSKIAPTSHSVQQRAVIPFGNGWLVFQL